MTEVCVCRNYDVRMKCMTVRVHLKLRGVFASSAHVKKRQKGDVVASGKSGSRM